MNIFERDALERMNRRTDESIVSVWVSFRAAFLELLDSYNDHHPLAAESPVKIISQSDYNIVIESIQGDHPKEQFSALVVTVRAEAQRQAFRIHCEIEHWRKRLAYIPPRTDSIKKMEFLLTNDGSALKLNTETLTPFQAAERLLGDALLGK